MAQDIIFVPGGDIVCNNQYGAGHVLDAITRDKSDTYRNQIGNFYNISPTGTTEPGKVMLEFGSENANKEGRIYSGYNGYITFDNIADFYNNHPNKPYNIVDIPLTNNLGQHYHLVYTLGVPVHSIVGTTVRYDCNVTANILADPNDLTSGVEIENFGSGTFFASDQAWCILADACYLKDEVFNIGDWDINDFPASEYCLQLFFYWYQNQSVSLPDYFTIKTNASGNSYMTNTSHVYSFSRIAALGYGWPEFSEENSPEVGPVSEEEPYNTDRQGAFNRLSDNVAIPDNPLIGASNVGFVRVYNTGLNSLTALGLELFPPLAYTAPQPITDNQSVSEAIVDGFNQIVTFLANVPSFFSQFMANSLINYVIDCHMIPVSPGAGTTEAIHVGSKTLTTTAGRIYTDYVDFSCGSINVGEFYGNFADYACTSGKLYLPFVGFVPTRPEWFTGSTLSVDYKFNVVDGSFACYVRSGGKHVGNGGSTIVGQYAGNACVHLPITGASYASMVSGLIGAGSGMLAGAATGNIPMAATSAIAAASAHGDIATSNSYNGSAAFLGCRRPYLMIERSVSNYAKNYQHEIGIPSNVYGRLGSLSGYVRMDNVHLDGIPCTDEERAYIAEALRKGVIV